MKSLANKMLIPPTVISEYSLKKIQQMFFRCSGIFIADSKEQLIINRLQGHMTSLGFTDFDQYSDFIEQAGNEKEKLTVVDLLTTNETYFFREPQHFNDLQHLIFPKIGNRPVRIWCAAASSGEEPYSIAMSLSEYFGMDTWELVASDISYRMLEKAKTGLYPMQRLENMPNAYLRKYCQKGVADYDGMFRVSESLRSRVKFLQHNLLDNASNLGLFDVIFVRNVMIYFDNKVKNVVLKNLYNQLRPGGWLITSHSESLIGNPQQLKIEKPSIYRRAP